MTPRPTLPLLERAALDDDGRAVWDEIARRAPVAPMIKVLAHHPSLLGHYWRLGVAVNDGIAIPDETLHLLALRVCQLDDSHYGWVQRLKKATAAGVPPPKVEALSDWDASEVFDADERLLLGLTETVVAGRRPDAELTAALQARFEPSVIVGVSVLVRYYVMNHKYVRVMGIEPEGE